MGDLIINPPPVVLGSSMDRGARYTEFNWASRPDAALYAGYNALVTFSDGKKRMMFSDGQYWRLEAPWVNLVPSASITGTTTKTLVQALVIPAGLVQIGDIVRLTLQYQYTGSTGNKTTNIEIAGQNLMQYGASTSGLSGLITKTFVRTATNTLMSVMPFATDQAITTATNPAFVSVDFTQAWTINIFSTLSVASEVTNLRTLKLEIN